MCTRVQVLWFSHNKIIAIAVFTEFIFGTFYLCICMLSKGDKYIFICENKYVCKCIELVAYRGEVIIRFCTWQDGAFRVWSHDGRIRRRDDYSLESGERCQTAGATSASWAQVIFIVKKTVGGTTWGRPCIGGSWRLGARWRSAAGNLLARCLVVWLFVSSCLLQLQSTVSLVYIYCFGCSKRTFLRFLCVSSGLLFLVLSGLYLWTLHRKRFVLFFSNKGG